ncbi:hypothetical protein SARC_05433 [Sphaeroforma arctica JP610]|uniref:Uncharacterized protein n=1 Tax=Sphaeroforma arctica JP610 TaxID=667725 RepID=A0A0L0G258_9EUKA|nr:hypothetical protein SARC_05433 [Sphaeroforma arctica JP610]KNC82278.1 hypothetical protein SARC_05433 [Sphaeroforma arctica JP610]|eukprot:XP_014156180.1 hypothetical protein SARC_05433 [Sphaeroforma arctica JP610]
MGDQIIVIDSPVDAVEIDQVFIRKSIKFVLPNNRVDEFVSLVKPQLPISPFKLPTGEVVESQVNNSSYFDDEYCNMFKERVVKAEAAELYRVRWYGNDFSRVEDLYVERKRHHNYKKVGKYSNKKRFDLPKEEMARFLLGAPVEELNPSKAKLASEVQTVMMQLKPKVRTQYLRTSFMTQDNTDLRITLDRDIAVYAEPNSWQNIANINGVASGEFDMMPYSVVEVKVSMVEGGTPECPPWIEEALFQSGARKIKLSKYGYGVMKLYPIHAHPSPKWAPEIAAWTSELGFDQQNTGATLAAPAVSHAAISIESPPSYRSNSFDNFTDTASTKSAMMRANFQRKYGNIFSKARRHGMNRKKYGKTDGKAFMANERTFLNYIQWTSSLATFCVGLLQIATGSEVLYVSTAIILFCDALIFYATIIYQLRRIYFVNNIASRGGRVPRSFNEWKVISAIMLVFFIAVNSYIVYMWVAQPEVLTGLTDSVVLPIV